MYKKITLELEVTDTKLIAVSKTKPESAILEMYEQGQRIFGENRVQEMVTKHANLPKDIEWHAIGHLQTNKVKQIAPFISLIHSIDSLRLLVEVNKEARKNDRVIDVLLQFHIADEETKYGFELVEVSTMLNKEVLEDMENVNIVGVMGMATFTEDEEQVRSEFIYLKKIFDELQEKFFSEKADFKEISMGMSGDYRIAVEEGSTMVRIGSLLFGKR
ncbi:MAG: pyridoxal phosphate enzyme (YggS family) [Saprospiraceae bacterium]|jgi:pyridoxal phosphate enzyme (YggS family)